MRVVKKFNIFILFLLAFVLVLPKQSQAAFNDVPRSHPNYNEIMFLLEKGVIDEGSTFGVSDIVTREEVAVMISKAVGLDGTPRDTVFPDVPKSNPNSGYIQSAVEAGIINGYADGTFKPDQKVTRGHMAAFISRAFDLPEGTKKFSDVSQSHTAYKAVRELAAAGITTGYPDGTFKPQDNLTRAHISAFLARAIEYSEGNDPKSTTLSKTIDDVTVRIDDVVQDADSLKIYVTYINNSAKSVGSYDSLTKIVADRTQYEYDSKFNRDRYYKKDVPHADTTISAGESQQSVIFFEPVEADTIMIQSSPGMLNKYLFNNVKIRKLDGNTNAVSAPTFTESSLSKTINDVTVQIDKVERTVVEDKNVIKITFTYINDTDESLRTLSDLTESYVNGKKHNFSITLNSDLRYKMKDPVAPGIILPGVIANCVVYFDDVDTDTIDLIFKPGYEKFEFKNVKIQ